MKRERRIILTILTFLIIGFAAITTTLVINGTIEFAANEEDFDIYFSEAILDGVDLTGVIISEDRQSIHFESKELMKIGDQSVLEYEVTNNSRQYDAEVKIECTGLLNSAYTTYTNTLTDRIIPAQTVEDGVLTVTLERMYAGDGYIEEEYTCRIIANAVERTSEPDSIIEAKEYYANGYLTTEDGEMVSNTNVVVYSDTPHYIKTDSRGFFHTTGLEPGEHEIYVIENKTEEEVKTLSKEEVIASSSAVGTFKTSTNLMEFENLIVEEYDIGPGNPITHEIILDVNGGLGDNYNILTIEGKPLGRLIIPDHETLAFYGWYVEDELYDETVIVTENIVDRMLATYGGGVAKIGEKQFMSIMAAIDYIKTPSTKTEIDVMVSHEVTDYINTNKNVLLDLNEYTVELGEYHINNNGTLEIDNGIMNASGIYGVYNKGTLILDSKLEFNKDDADFLNSTYVAPAIYNNENATVTVNEATISTIFTENKARAITNLGTININGINLLVGGTSTGLLNNEGTINITKANFDSSAISGNSIMNYENAEININATGNDVVFKGMLGGSSYFLVNEGSLNITSGNIINESGAFLGSYGNLSIGSSTTNPSITGSTGETLIDIRNGENNEIISGTISNSNYYALNVRSGATLLLGDADIAVDSDAYTYRAVTVSGTLNVDGGTITAKNASQGCVQVNAGGILNFYDGLLDGAGILQGNSILVSASAEMNIGSNGGNVEIIGNGTSSYVLPVNGTLNIKEGNVSLSNGAIIYAVGTVNIGEVGKTLNIDIASGTSFATVYTNGNLNVYNGNLTSSNYEMLRSFEGGNINISGGNLTIDSTTSTARLINTYGTLNITGGKLTAKGSAFGVITAGANSTVNLVQGTIDVSQASANAYAGAANSVLNVGSDSSTITILGLNGYPSLYSNGETNYLGGTLTQDISTIFAVTGEFNINKGTITAQDGRIARVYNTGTLNIYDGTFKSLGVTSQVRMFHNEGITNILGGTFTSSGKSYGIVENFTGSTLNVNAGTFDSSATASNAVMIYADSVMNLGSPTNTIKFNGYQESNTLFASGELNITEGNIQATNADFIGAEGNVNIGQTSKTLNITLSDQFGLIFTVTGANVNIYNITTSVKEMRLGHIESGSTMIIHNGHFTIDNPTVQMRMFRNSGTLTINAGTFIAKSGSYGIITASNASTTHILGGTYQGLGNNSNIIHGEAGSTINLGKASSTAQINVTAVSTSSPTIAINGIGNFYTGNVSADASHALLNEGGTITIAGGKFVNNSSTISTVHNESGTLTMTGGTITNSGGFYTLYNKSGTVKQTGGTSAKNYGVS